MVTSELIHDGHIKRLTITRHSAGWEICEEHDSEVVRTTSCRDWHRVERAQVMFALAHHRDETARRADHASTNL